MARREPRVGPIIWSAFNLTYGPWYRIPNTKVIVQPDMDKSRWYWTVPGKRGTEPKWGTAPTLAEAKAEAEAVWLRQK